MQEILLVFYFPILKQLIMTVLLQKYNSQAMTFAKTPDTTETTAE